MLSNYFTLKCASWNLLYIILQETEYKFGCSLQGINKALIVKVTHFNQNKKVMQRVRTEYSYPSYHILQSNGGHYLFSCDNRIPNLLE